MLKCLIRVEAWSWGQQFFLSGLSQTLSYLVSDVFPFTKMGISRSAGMHHLVD